MQKRTTTLLHSADLHLGYRQYGIPKREEDLLKALDDIVARAILLKVDGIILAGDIFDTAKPTAYTVRRVQQAVEKAQQQKIQVVGIDGNHDIADSNWLNVCGITSINKQPVQINNLTILGMAYTRPTLFKETLKQMAESGQRADVFVMHQAVAEMADFVAQELSLLEITPHMVTMGVKYVAMGDIHDYKEMEIGGVRYAYSGSPEVTALDERRDKSCSIITFGPDGCKTQMELLTPRVIVEKFLRTETDLNDLLQELERDPLMILWYDPANRDLARRAETLLNGSTIMHRICPLAVKDVLTTQMTRTIVERQNSLQHLKSIISSCFEATSDEYQLIFQLLNTPDSIETTVKDYIKSKERNEKS